jgi:hypothetical protein
MEDDPVSSFIERHCMAAAGLRACVLYLRPVLTVPFPCVPGKGALSSLFASEQEKSSLVRSDSQAMPKPGRRTCVCNLCPARTIPLPRVSQKERLGTASKQHSLFRRKCHRMPNPRWWPYVLNLCPKK